MNNREKAKAVQKKFNQRLGIYYGVMAAGVIVAAIGLLEPLRIASERLRLRKMGSPWTLQEIVEEALTILRERSSTPLDRRIGQAQQHAE